MLGNNRDLVMTICASVFIREFCTCRFLAKNMFQVDDPDYYEWESHIFFDDAFTQEDGCKHEVVNQFVRLLVRKIDEEGKKR